MANGVAWCLSNALHFLPLTVFSPHLLFFVLNVPPCLAWSCPRFIPINPCSCCSLVGQTVFLWIQQTTMLIVTDAFVYWTIYIELTRIKFSHRNFFLCHSLHSYSVAEFHLLLLKTTLSVNMCLLINRSFHFNQDLKTDLNTLRSLKIEESILTPNSSNDSTF